MKNKLFYFLLFTIIITSLSWGSLYFLVTQNQLSFGQPVFMILFALGGWAPTFSVFIAIAIAEGKSGFSAYWRRLFRFKVSFWYYLSSLLLLLFLGMVPAVINGQVSEKFSLLANTSWGMVPVLFVSSLFFGGLEELGWRGFLQHELQKKYNIWLVYGAVWVIWTVWHLPLFFIPGLSQFNQNFWIFSIYALFFSLILGWLYSRTKSIPLAVFTHTLVNTLAAVAYLDFLSKETLHWATVVIMLLTLVGLNLVFPAEKPKQK